MCIVPFEWGVPPKLLDLEVAKESSNLFLLLLLRLDRVDGHSSHRF